MSCENKKKREGSLSGLKEKQSGCKAFIYHSFIHSFHSANIYGGPTMCQALCQFSLRCDGRDVPESDFLCTWKTT